MASNYASESLNEKDLPIQSKRMSQIEDYADAKLIEEMMDMDAETFLQKSKQKRAEEREIRKEEERKKEETEEEENMKGEASKLDTDSNDEHDGKGGDQEGFEKVTTEFIESLRYSDGL